MAVETFECFDDFNTQVVFSASITTRDSDGRVTRVDWNNPGPYVWVLTIVTPSKGDLVTSIPIGSGQRGVGANLGYLIDGPQGAGYTIGPGA